MALRMEVRNLDGVRKALAAAGEKGRRAMPRAVKEGAGVLRDEMADRAPGDGIGVEMEAETRALIGPDKDHFYYVFFERGTGAHRVAPRSKKALKIGGQFAAWANPGGIAARPFMRPAVDEGQDEVERVMGEVIRGEIE